MDFAQMKDFSEFCEQLNEMRLRFHKWDSCERTVALYYLMAGLPFANARFLQNALEQCIQEVITPEAQVLERNANDPVFVSRFRIQRPEVVVLLVLAHLPLLRPGNKEAAAVYLSIIRKTLMEFMKPNKMFNECVELMSYVFVHPAFRKEDKKSFKRLLKEFVNRDSIVNESSDESSSEQVNSARMRSNSLTPSENVWSSQENLAQTMTKPRSYSLSIDKSLPVTVLQSSSSETRLEELQTMANLPVMKSIVAWLKSLRLHKYSWVFNNLTYDQMLNLTEESLASIGITKGARHKLLLSIAKLKERSTLLTELETEVMNGGDLLNALKKMKVLLVSPLQVSSGEDLPMQFVRVMGKVCTQLLMLRQPSEEALTLYVTISERAVTLEAFTTEQKRRLTLWSQQLSSGTYAKNYNNRQQISSNYNRHYGNNHHQSQYQMHLQNVISQQVYNAQKSSSYPSMQHRCHHSRHRHSIGCIRLKRQSDDAESPVMPRKTQNLVKTTNTNHVRFQEAEADKKQKSIDIESSLESLCLQMMEHALGP